MAEIRDADARFAEGVRLFDAGDYEGAIKEFSAVITVDPNRKQAYLYRTKAYQTHDRERAKEVTPPEIQGDGSFWGGFLWIFIPIIALSALSTLGVSFERFYWLWYISVGVFAVGIIATLITLRFDKVLTTKGMAIAVIIGLVTLAATCGVNVATCLKYCDFSGLARRVGMTEMEDADARFAEGVRLFDAGGYEGAIKEFTAVIAADPSHQEAYGYLSEANQARERTRRQKVKEEKPLKIEGYEGDGSFWVGFLGVGIPIFTFGIVSAIGAQFAGLWFASAGAFVIGIIALFIIRRSGRPETGTGMMIALIIGVILLVVTCTVNVNNVEEDIANDPNWGQIGGSE